MLVSVVVITYNHEKYIAKALDSILAQKRDFDIEILIGDDSSLDRTPEIVTEYAEKYPDIIKAVLRDKNIGATRNSYELFVNAKGDYIAVLEGDDYWIDTEKLSKQLDFMETHKEFAGCCCEFQYVDVDGEPLIESKEKMLRGQLYYDGEVYGLSQMCSSILPSHAGTMFFRNIFRDGIDATIIYKAHDIIGDFTIVMLILSKGEIYKSKDIMSCYRHIEKSGASWSAKAAANPFHFYEIFMYHTALENFANNTLKMPLSLKVTKEKSFFSMSQNYQYSRSRAMRKCIEEMLRLTRDKSHYIKMYCLSRMTVNIPGSIKTMIAHEKDKTIHESMDITWRSFNSRIGSKKVILYGAGGGCYEFSKRYFHDYKVECVIDNDREKQGNYIDAYRICGREKLEAYDPKDIIVVITTGVYANEIKEELNRMGINEVYSYTVMEAKKLKYLFAKLLCRNKEIMK